MTSCLIVKIELGAAVLFYFNIIEGAFEIPDPEGSDLPDEQAAQMEALAIAEELEREFPGRFLRNSIVEVISETGKRVLAFPIGSNTLAHVALLP